MMERKYEMTNVADTRTQKRKKKCLNINTDVHKCTNFHCIEIKSVTKQKEKQFTAIDTKNRKKCERHMQACIH